MNINRMIIDVTIESLWSVMICKIKNHESISDMSYYLRVIYKINPYFNYFHKNSIHYNFSIVSWQMMRLLLLAAKPIWAWITTILKKWEDT